MEKLRAFNAARFPPQPKAKRHPLEDEGGIVLHELFSRKVIRHGDKVTKVNDMGIRPSEAAAMRFVRENTTIPVPRVYETTPTSITMDYVEGDQLEKVWDGLPDAERAAISDQLADYIRQMRSLEGSYIGGIDETPAVVSRQLFQIEGGPFATEDEYNSFILSDVHDACSDAVRSMIRSQMRTDHRIVFTHGDLSALNILVRNGLIVAIIDWETAGFLPEYVELVNPLRHASWRVGYYSALLDIFPCRYDADYILHNFIARLSKN